MSNLVFLVAGAAAAAATRLLPHAPNFTAVGALALFAGAKFSGKWAWIAPLAVMFASDAAIGFYDWRLMAVVYASFLVFAGMGRVVRSTAGGEKKNGSEKHSNILQNVRMFFMREYPIRIGCASLAGSTLFFLTTNFAVWLMSDWYPKTLGGLMLSYAYGAPFFRNMALGDLFYSGIFFGAYALIPAVARYFRNGSRMGIAHVRVAQYTVNK